MLSCCGTMADEVSTKGTPSQDHEALTPPKSHGSGGWPSLRLLCSLWGPLGASMLLWRWVHLGLTETSDSS